MSDVTESEIKEIRSSIQRIELSLQKITSESSHVPFTLETQAATIVRMDNIQGRHTDRIENLTADITKLETRMEKELEKATSSLRWGITLAATLSGLVFIAANYFMSHFNIK